MSKLTASLLIFVLCAQTISAKPKGDWTLVKELANHSVAVKTRKGETLYGFLHVADDTQIQIKIAGYDDFTGQEIGLRRDEVAKVWRARLRFGEKNVAKAAWIGAGAGLAAALITTAVLAARNTSDPSIAGGFYPLIGAGVGALAGKLWKKKHKKQELVYSV